ncbi:hypothetical protein LR1_02050 [Lacticaseibacillus rhamnosus DSM 20021 = JCM 1136 = NBRC 3425]|nr:hypothetical protein LR1_02050 [Lacticaseibacillus rhamnosus DSM 20021 = JCM 1136 = NBRC 3425]
MNALGIKGMLYFNKDLSIEVSNFFTEKNRHPLDPKKVKQMELNAEKIKAQKYPVTPCFKTAIK